MKDLEAFETFNFKIGDTVLHVTDKHRSHPYVVVGRGLLETTSGVQRYYHLSGSEQSATALEMELRST